MNKKGFALILCIMLSLVLVFLPMQLTVKGDSTIFSDGFESGTLLKSDVPLGHWDSKSTEGSGTVQASSDQANNGVYSCKVYGATANDAALLTEGTETNAALTDDVRFYMRLNTSFNDGDNCEFANHEGVGGWSIWRLAVCDSDYKLAFIYNTNLNSPVEIISSKAKVSLNNLHCFEVKFIRDNGNGEYNVYLDGNEVNDLAQTGLQTGNIGDPNVLQLGNALPRQYSSLWTSYYDDVVWADSYIGPVPSDISPPTFGSVYTNTTTTGQPCSFDCLVNDNTNVSSYIFSTNNTGSWVNDTVATFSSFYNSTAAWANVTKTLKDTKGDTVGYLWYANDTSNNWGDSDQYNLTLTAPYTLGLQLAPTAVTCRRYEETFTLNLTISNAVDTSSLKFEIHYNATLLNCSSVTWTAWGSGSVTVDQTYGVVNGSTLGTPLNDNQTLVTLQFTELYHHIWKNISGWINDVSDTVFIQSANLSSTTNPDLMYVRGRISQISIGPDVSCTFSPIRGDVDNNGAVDITDLSTVAFYYDTANEAYNLAGDSTVDIFDLVVVASNFFYEY
jgi:hypothetical protein